jgi:hypothetical protein
MIYWLAAGLLVAVIVALLCFIRRERSRTSRLPSGSVRRAGRKKKELTDIEQEVRKEIMRIRVTGPRARGTGKAPRGRGRER